jgi:flagellar biogenesis protein FliO
MDGLGQTIVHRSILLLSVLCSPLASIAQDHRRGEIGPAEASADPTTYQSGRNLSGPAARFTFSDAPSATDDSSANVSEVRLAVHEETTTAEKQWPQGGPKYKAPMPPEPPDLRALVTRFVFGTAAVLVACVACLWLARRWLSNNTPAGKGDGRMKLVATVSLSNRSSLQLVDIEGQKVLVGSDASGIKTVTPLAESFLDNLQQADGEEVGDDRERFPFESLRGQVT